MSREGILKIYSFLSDNIYDILLGDNWEEYKDKCNVADIIEKEIEIPTKRKLCSVFGHHVVMDSCGKIEHDYCILCKKLIPGDACDRL